MTCSIPLLTHLKATAIVLPLLVASSSLGETFPTITIFPLPKQNLQSLLDTLNFWCNMALCFSLLVCPFCSFHLGSENESPTGPNPSLKRYSIMSIFGTPHFYWWSATVKTVLRGPTPKPIHLPSRGDKVCKPSD